MSTDITTIGLVASDQLLTVTQRPKVASGSRKSVQVSVTFDDTWDEYSKSAVFYTSLDSTVYEVLLTNGVGLIPHEVLVEACTLYIGIRGTKSGTSSIKPSAVIKYRIDQGAPLGTATSEEVSPTVYEQLLTSIEKTQELAQSVVDDAEAGKFNGTSPVKGVDYFTEEEKQEIVDEVLAALPDAEEVGF